MNFIFDFLKPDYSRLEDHYQILIEINITKLPDYNDSYIELLLTKVIELFWHKDYSSNKWKNLIKKWSCHKGVKHLYSRIKVQTCLLYNWELEESENLINEEFPIKDNLLNHFLAKAWFCVFSEKWTKLDDLIFEMKKYIPFESEYALSVQGLINIRCTSRENTIKTFNKTPHDKIFADYLKTIPGILRYQRIQMTRPMASFYSQLETYLDTKIAELKKEPYGKGYIRTNLLSISKLLRLQALRLWDLEMYRRVTKRRCDLLLEIGMYHNQYGKYAGEYMALINAIILFTTEITNHKINEFNEIKKAHYLLENSPYIKKHINKITKISIEVFPNQYSSVIAILRIMGDSVPDISLEDISCWSVKMFNHFTSNFYDFKVNCLNFWVDIFKYHKISTKMWTILESAFQEMFHNPEYWQSSKAVLIIALQKAPIEKVVQWANCIAQVKVDNIFMEQVQYEILSKVTANTEALNQIVDEYLNIRIADVENDDLEKREFWRYESLLLNNTQKSQTEHEYVQQYLIKQLIQKCNSTHSNLQGFFLSLKTDYYTEFARIDWSTCQSELLIEAINLLEDTIYQSSDLTDSDIGELLLPMSNITQTAPSEVVKRIVVFVRKIIDNPPLSYSKVSPDIPFSDLVVEYNAKKDINFAIVNIIDGFYHLISEREKAFFRKWAVKEIHTTSLSNLGIFSKVLLRIYLNSKYSIDHTRSYKALTVIYDRVQQSDELASVLYNLSITLQNEDINRYLFPGHPLTNFLNRFIQISYKYPDPQIRENCASLVSTIIKLRVSVDKQIIDTLKYDARARVRRFFTD